MNSSPIGRIVSPAFGLADTSPSQGQLLSELLAALLKAAPASGTRKASAKEIGEALKLSDESLARFMPLVINATIGSAELGGAVTLQLRKEFRFRPHPESHELIIELVLRGNVSPGKLEVEEGLVVVAGFVKANIERIEECTEKNVRGVRVVTSLGSEFYPL